MKKDLLVTLADKNYIDQAKQLFSSAYWNAGWQGDYMLLAYEIPDEKLKWFKDKGILIKKCEPIYDTETPDRLITDWSKFYLFTTELKIWKNIVYLDSDIIVRASLDELTKARGLVARCDAMLNWQLRRSVSVSLNKNDEIKDAKLFAELKKNYNLKERGFNAGVMVFSTDIIKKNTFSELKKLSELYGRFSWLGAQPVLSLFFYKNYILLPYAYNCDANYLTYVLNIKPEKITAIILHFNYPNRPWMPQNPFHKEWKDNLNKAELMDIKNIPLPRETWTEDDIKEYLRKLHFLHFHKYVKWKIAGYIIGIFRLCDKILGLVGIFLKNNFPNLYFWLKKLKGKK